LVHEISKVPHELFTFTRSSTGIDISYVKGNLVIQTQQSISNGDYIIDYTVNGFKRSTTIIIKDYLGNDGLFFTQMLDDLIKKVDNSIRNAAQLHHGSQTNEEESPPTTTTTTTTTTTSNIDIQNEYLESLLTVDTNSTIYNEGKTAAPMTTPVLPS